MPSAHGDRAVQIWLPAFREWVEMGSPVSLISVRAASHLCSAWASLTLGCAWGPQSRGSSGQFSHRVKLQSRGARGAVGIFMLLRTGEDVWESHSSSVRSSVFVHQLHLYNQSCGVLGSPGFPGASFSLGFHLFPCAFHPPKRC